MFMSISRKFLFLHDIQLSIFGWNLIHWDSEKLLITALSPSFSTSWKSSRITRRSFLCVSVNFFICIIQKPPLLRQPLFCFFTQNEPVLRTQNRPAKKYPCSILIKKGNDSAILVFKRTRKTGLFSRLSVLCVFLKVDYRRNIPSPLHQWCSFFLFSVPYYRTTYR